MDKVCEFSVVQTMYDFVDYEKLQNHVHKNVISLQARFKEDQTSACINTCNFCKTDILPYLQALCKKRNSNKHLPQLATSEMVLSDGDMEFQTKLSDVVLALLQEISVSSCTEPNDRFQIACDFFLISLHLCDQKYAEVMMNKFLTKCIDSLMLTVSSCITNSEENLPVLSEITFSIENIVAYFCYFLDEFSVKRFANANKFVIYISTFGNLHFAQIKALLIKVLPCLNDQLVVCILLELLPKISATEQCTGICESLIVDLWTIVMQSFKESECGNIQEINLRGYLILSCISDHIFVHNAKRNMPIWASAHFWKILQFGLVHADPLHRKRSLYFLKRVLDCLQNNVTEIPEVLCGHLFSWKHDQASEIQKAFNSLMLVLETLEEKQVHVMKPLLPIVNSLHGLTIEKKTWFLHTSWLIVIYQRLLQHDSKTIKKWAVEQICNINFSDTPIFQQKMEKFFWSSFLEGLNNNSLYARKPNESFESCANIGNKLIKHYLSCHEALQTDHERAQFFQQVLKNLQAQSWGAVPLLYVTHALAAVPQSPLWNTTSIGDLREVLTNSLRAHETVVRAAIQGFLLEAFIRLINLTELTINDLSLVMGTFKKSECLQRGSQHYVHLVTWLQRTIQEADTNHYNGLHQENVLQFLSENLCSILDDDRKSNTEEFFVDKDSREMLRIARLMILLSDAKILTFLPGENSFRSSLELLMDTLKTCHSRPYMTTGKPEKCAAFLLLLATEAECYNEQSPDDLQKCIVVLFEEILPTFLPYLLQKLFDNAENYNEHYGNIKLYFDFLESTTKIDNLRSSLQIFLKRICKNSLQILEMESGSCNFLQHYIAVKCFHTACLFLKSYPDVKNKCQQYCLEDFLSLCVKGNLLSTVLKDSASISFSDRMHKTNPNHIHSDYISVVWSCACFCIKHCRLVNETEAGAILKQSTKGQQVCSDSAMKSIYNCLESIFPQIILNDSGKVASTLEICWKTVSNMKINAAFWDAMDAFITMAFQPALIQDDLIATQLSNYAAHIAERSEACHGLFLPLVRRTAAIWKMPEYQLSMLNYMPLIVSALTFGHIHRKDQRIVQDTVKFVSTLGNSCTTATTDRSVNDSEVRVEAAVLIISLQASVHHEKIIPILVQSLIEHEKAITSTRSRHFANSLIHRVKQRIWQTLLLLQPLCSQETVEIILDTSFKMIVEESLQPSVRYLIEWLILKMLHKDTTMIYKIWSNFEWATQRRVGSLGSFLSIICHLGNLLPDKNQQTTFIEKAFPVVLPWCMAQHFNTRIYAQVALHKLWNCCKENNFENLLKTYFPVENLFSINIEHGGTAKGIQKLLDYYNFSAFDQLRHYSIQTIFYELPRLSNVVEEEWIEPEMFIKCDPMLKLNQHLIPLHNPDNVLSQCAPGAWVDRSTADDYCDSLNQENKDVQRKLTPWKQMIPDYDALMSTSQSTLRKKQQNSEGLIVVASLIDRAPNLGGLCRTCEVFGVSTYVIGNLRYVEDKQFQSLSVSADKWVQIKEVKTSDLQEYLLYIKKCGYTVIGAEQTINSCKLGSFKFPTKTVLVLGNEKEGIPVELIQLLDICVEIPQEGLIRSLNVHVTGAILIWEYARQKNCQDLEI